MKKAIILLMLFIISACVPIRTSQQQSVPRETKREIEIKAADVSNAEKLIVKELDGYFLKNDVKLADDVNFFTVGDQKGFDELLGQAKTMTNAVTIADFKNNMVAVIAMKPSQTLNNIKITKAYCIGSDVYLDYEIVPEAAQEIGYFVSNVKAFEIQRPKQILNVSFVDKNRSMTILPFGKRTIGSPANLEVLLKYYTGRYKGTIPAASGPGITMILTLSNDYTYRLEETYLKTPARTFESSGTWKPSDDLSFFILDYDDLSDEQTAFYFLDRNTIELLNIYCERQDTDMKELYRLKK
jgi:hypothetical protein